MILIWIISAAAVILIAQYYWSRRHFYAAAAKFKGPRGLPILGNALSFFCNSEDMLDRIKLLFQQIGNEPYRLWLGPYLLIALKNPIHLEKIMSSQKFAYKHELYSFLEKLVGDGLITASGLKPKYKIHRRIIQPMFDLKFIISAIPIMNFHINLCMERLTQFINQDNFNVITVISSCSMNTIAEIVMGQKLNTKNGIYTKLCETLLKMLNIGYTRMTKVWLHPDFIYNWHQLKEEENNTMANLHSFINEALIDTWIRRKLIKSESTFVPIIDTLSKFIETHPNVFDEGDLSNHLITLLTASEDTFSIITSFSIVCFGMYPEYQEKAAKEIRNVIGEEIRDLTLEDIYKLSYLDMCIKDVMRLFPIAPIILRRTLEDFHLDRWIIPKGAAIAIPIYFLHRDPQHWENPEHFHPDHFLPEVTQQRHPYAYLPFSAGPRGCIGKTMANINIKLFLGNFLQRYEVMADGKVPDIELRTDISVRPKMGYNCRIRERQWKNQRT